MLENLELSYNLVCFVGFRGNLHQIACEKWPTCSDSERTKMARMASAAAWGLG
jgi:hypothetical protein